MIQRIKPPLLACGVAMLSGCVISTSSSLDDYAGADAAKLRVSNNADALTLHIYTRVGSCLQEVDSKSLTAGINVLGIKSTRNKTVAGIAPVPEGSPLKGLDVMEYTIKAGQYLSLGYSTVSETQYSQTRHDASRSFVPTAGHSYEAYTGQGGYYINEVIITDITQGKNDLAPTWPLKECKYQYNMLRHKIYSDVQMN